MFFRSLFFAAGTLVFLLFPPNLNAAESKGSALVPKGWTISEEAEGDLNGDKRNDLVMTITRPYVPKNEDDYQDDDVNLLVYLSDPSGDLKLHVEAPKALCWGCGGMVGGNFPFTLSISKKVLTVEFMSGSASSGSYLKTKWRLNGSNEFQLIGVTDDFRNNIMIREDPFQEEEEYTSIDVNLSNRKGFKSVKTPVLIRDAVKYRIKKTDFSLPKDLEPILLSKFNLDGFFECKDPLSVALRPMLQHE